MSRGGHTGDPNAVIREEAVSQRCPTCGQAVQVVTSDEGTSHYEAAVLREAVDQVNGLRAELAAAREEIQRLNHDAASWKKVARQYEAALAERGLL